MNLTDKQIEIMKVVSAAMPVAADLDQILERLSYRTSKASLQFSLLTGASFLDHPGGEGVEVPYTIEIVDREHPATQGVSDFEIAAEQYYMHLDPGVHVLARSTFGGQHWPWLEGVTMPAAFVRTWGQGRVFYSSPGHVPAELQIPAAERLVRQGLQWAARR